MTTNEEPFDHDRLNEDDLALRGAYDQGDEQR